VRNTSRAEKDNQQDGGEKGRPDRGKKRKASGVISWKNLGGDVKRMGQGVQINFQVQEGTAQPSGGKRTIPCVGSKVLAHLETRIVKIANRTPL